MPVTPRVSTPGEFLYGGYALGAGLVALEAASGRPAVWATAQYLSFASTGSTLDLQVTLAASGRRVTQGRAVGRVGDREILTVNAALGVGDLPADGTWVTPPDVPRPEACPPRVLPPFIVNSVLNRVEMRVAKGRMMGDLDGRPGDGESAFWARMPDHLDTSVATLAILGDYVSGAVSQPLGRRTMGRSLDNTLRVVRIAPTEWVLCDILMHGLHAGFAHGEARLWTEDGVLLAVASQTVSVRFWDRDAVRCVRTSTDRPRSARSTRSLSSA